MDKLEARNLSVFYGANKALSSVSLRIPKGQITALIGPSGCGKSTMLRCFNRMNDTVPGCRIEGEVRLDDELVTGPNADPVLLRRRVGMVFQKPNPFPKSVFDNVAFGLRIAGEVKGSALQNRVEDALKAAALWEEVKDRLDRSALGLSGGQQQRLCIARALALEPEVLLLDEATSALDPIATARIEELLQELKASYTLVCVTHNMQQARRTSDRTAFFYLGDLVEDGPTEEIFGDPQAERTRAYVTGAFG